MNFWDERYFVVEIFPCRKWEKWAEMVILDIWQKLQNWPRIGPYANYYISARVSLIFWLFWHQFGPKLKPNHWPNFHLILIEELGLENISFGGWVLPQNPSSLIFSIPSSTHFHFPSHFPLTFHLPSSIHASIKFLLALGVDGKWLELGSSKGSSNSFPFSLCFWLPRFKLPFMFWDWTEFGCYCEFDLWFWLVMRDLNSSIYMVMYMFFIVYLISFYLFMVLIDSLIELNYNWT